MNEQNQSVVDAIKGFIPNIKHCKLLGIDVVDIESGKLTLCLPYSQTIIGNPQTGVIHGGALTTLMDNCCGFAAVSSLSDPGICPTLDLRIDYMRSATPGETVYGFAEAYRTTSNVVFTRGFAYHQGQSEQPIAHCTATFMRIDEPRSSNETNTSKEA